MKYLLALMSGFFLTLVVFVSGAAVTIVYLTAEPVPIRKFDVRSSGPWTNEPLRIASATPEAPQTNRRSNSEATVQTQADPGLREPDTNLDSTTTATIDPDPAGAEAFALEAAHDAWCAEQYRSYDAEDNRYNTFSGERRACVSPFSKAGGDLEAQSAAESVMNVSSGESASGKVENASESFGAQLSSEHIQSCFARYRSYRAEDNTYQPYGGGPRRQCR